MKNKPKKKDMITGYYVDLPAGANTAAINGGDDTPLGELDNVTYTPETSTHYGLLEWDDSEVIESVVVNETEAVEVQTLIGGVHAPQRPK